MALTASTRSWGGITFGGSSPYQITSETGLDDLSARSASSPLPRYHGDIPGDHTAAGRTITLNVWWLGNDAAHGQQLRDALAAATVIERTALAEYGFKHADGDDRVVFARVRRRHLPRNIDTEAAGYHTATIEFEVTDPAQYAAAVSTAKVEPYVSAAGLPWPIVWPASWGAGGSGGGVIVPLGGTWETWPVYTINGPSTGVLTDPVIENVTAGTRLALTANGGVAISAGQKLIIDTHPRRRTIRFDTGASRYGKLSDDSVWSPMNPGNNEVRFRAAGATTDASVDVSVRAAYL